MPSFTTFICSHVIACCTFMINWHCYFLTLCSLKVENLNFKCRGLILNLYLLQVFQKPWIYVCSTQVWFAYPLHQKNYHYKYYKFQNNHGFNFPSHSSKGNHHFSFYLKPHYLCPQVPCCFLYIFRICSFKTLFVLINNVIKWNEINVFKWNEKCLY